MSGHHPFDKLRAQMTPERRARNAAKTQALLAASPQQALQQASGPRPCRAGAVPAGHSTGDQPAGAPDGSVYQHVTALY